MFCCVYLTMVTRSDGTSNLGGGAPQTPCPLRSTSVLEFEGLTKEYPRGLLPGRRVSALDRVSARIEPGESVAILGPNGSGKSTLLKIVMGFVRPGGGTVTVFGFPPGHPKALARIGYLPETLSVPHSYTVRHALTLAFRRGGSAARGKDRQPARS